MQCTYPVFFYQEFCFIEKQSSQFNIILFSILNMIDILYSHFGDPTTEPHNSVKKNNSGFGIIKYKIYIQYIRITVFFCVRYILTYFAGHFFLSFKCGSRYIYSFKQNLHLAKHAFYHIYLKILEKKELPIQSIYNRPSFDKGSDQLIVTLYTLPSYPFIHNQLIRTLFEAFLLFYIVTIQKG